MRISELTERASAGTYVGVHFSDKTIENLKRFQEEHNIPNPLDAEKFHTTLVYSRRTIDWTPADDISHEKASAKGWEVFEGRAERNRILVLLLDSDYLQSRFTEAMDLGATYDFDAYRPHITLSYDIGEFDIDHLPVPDFDIEMDSEYCEPLNLEWSSAS